MIKSIKRSTSIFVSLVLVLAIICGVNLQVNAAIVDYVYVGTYIKNWGIREQTATFLSQNAEAFYKDNNTSYSELISFAGSSDIDAIPSSELFKELHNLMANAQNKQTSYGETRNLFKYTDIQNSGKTSDKISSFYSGKEIGPNWDTGKTWNREHTWPNSKGDMSGNGENDIMMLRPTATSENGSRSNDAYGTNGFYDPNKESEGKHNLHGDVARIILYQYVRWECTKASDTSGGRYSIFGTKGVIESREVLLAWMQEDPVDTWELGRNDSVESITGTRNVFVDYPELAFVLFGQQVPENYQTPSSNNQGDSSSTQPSNPSSNTSSSQTPNVPQTNSSYNGTSSSQPSGDSQQNNYAGAYGCYHTRARIVEAEAPRCETEGYTEGKYCPDCKEYISGRELIEATGHTYDGDCDASCNVCSSVREIAVDVKHNFENDVCTICAVENAQKDALDEQQTSVDEQDNSKGKNAWWIILLAVVVVGTGATLVVIYRDKIWPKEKE